MKNDKAINTERDISIDLLRGFGIILMVMAHVGFGSVFEFVKSAFNMPTFFLISGYLYKQKNYSIGQFFLRECKRLIIPMASFGIITFLYCMVINLSVGESVYAVRDFFVGFLWGNKGIFPIAGALWFLQALLFTEVIFYLITRINKGTLHLVFVVVFSILAIACYRFDVSLPLSIDSSMGLYVFYYSGYLYRHIDEENVKQKMHFPQIYAVIVSLVIGLMLLFLNGKVNPRTCTYGKSYICYVVVALLINWSLYHLLKFVSQIPHTKIWDPVLIPGKYSIAFLGLNQVAIDFWGIVVGSTIFSPLLNVKPIRSIMIFSLVYLSVWIISKLLYNTRLKFVVGISINRK